MAIQDLWVEKHRPSKMADYVWIDSNQKNMVESWIRDKSIPHLLLSGGAGTGKTTLAKVLINELDVESADVLVINASRNNSVDDVRGKITNFGQTMPFGEFKIILLDEADYLSPNAQAALRGVMEQYQHVLRFIITCNYPDKIIPAIHSRCQGFNFRNLDETEFMVRVGSILGQEGIEFDVETLIAFTKAHYPDLRKTINQVQQCSTSGRLVMPEGNDDVGKDYRLEMVTLFRQGKKREARDLICSQINLDEYQGMYKFLYRNLDFFGATNDEKDEALFIIRQGLINHGLIADPEINLSATMTLLEQIGK
jgi:DNA polymerase III delta prime subunit